MSSNLNIKIENIRNVEIKSKCVPIKDHPPKIVTAVHFEYDGDPSMMEDLLTLETEGQRINAAFDSPQFKLDMDKK